MRGRQGNYFYLSFPGPSLSCLVWAVQEDPVLKTQWGLAGVAQEVGSLAILFKRWSNFPSWKSGSGDTVSTDFA